MIKKIGRHPTPRPENGTEFPQQQITQTPQVQPNTNIQAAPGVRKIIFENPLCPGDITVSTAAIRDLHLSHPGKFITDVHSPCPAIFENNPYITKLDKNDPSVEKIRMDYPLIHKSNQSSYHFIHGYIQDMEKKLGVSITPTSFKGEVYISDTEKSWVSQVREIIGEDRPYWVFICGHKTDYTAKAWDPYKMYEVVEKHPDITFVQVGEDKSGHIHYEIDMPNVINLIGATDLRQLIRVVYHAAGVICPVTFLMHLSAAMPPKAGFPQRKPCIVLSGSREPDQWEMYPNHRYLSKSGCLPCNDGNFKEGRSGGCWKSRTVSLGDNDDKDNSLCEFPVTIDEQNKIYVPKCMDMITSDEVSKAISDYMTFYDYYGKK